MGYCELILYDELLFEVGWFEFAWVSSQGE